MKLTLTIIFACVALAGKAQMTIPASVSFMHKICDSVITKGTHGVTWISMTKCDFTINQEINGEDVHIMIKRYQGKLYSNAPYKVRMMPTGKFVIYKNGRIIYINIPKRELTQVKDI